MPTKSPAFQGSESDIFRCFADRNQRRILSLLCEQTPLHLTPRDLAVSLTPTDPTTSPEHQTQAVRKTELRLLHVYLPTLEAGGLIDWDSNRGTTTISDHPAFEDRDVRELLATEESADPQSRDALFAALADAHRRVILDVLSHQHQSIHTETLAREILAKERNTTEQDVPSEDVNQLLTLFHHSHLPRLHEAGIIDYDTAQQTVFYTGHPLLRVSWMHSHIGPDFRVSLTDSPKGADVWTVNGREQVVSYGQSLCESADEELFLLLTTTGLLEAGCFTRILQAIDRGVDIYLGTHDPTVHEFVQENAPEITLWEPQTSWLDLPISGESMGRLLLADREAVLIGTLGEQIEGDHEEQAIAGEGDENPLVVLLRQLLGPKLEQFDEEGDELGSNLPF